MPHKYKIKIDKSLCIGAGSCLIAEKTFRLNAENKAEVTKGNDPDDLIMQAAVNCPTKAIILEENRKQIYP